MTRLILHIIILTILAVSLKGQTDDKQFVEYFPGYRFTDGIYFSHLDLLLNKPLKPELIVSPDLNKGVWFEELEKHKSISYFDEFGNLAEVQIKDLWGYCRNGRPYIYWAGKFNLIPYIGRVSHFVATIRVVYDDHYRSPFYDPYYYHSPRSVRYQDELRQYLIDFDTGTIFDFDVTSTEYILKRDESLYEDFSKLRKRRKNKMMFYYIRQYNERNPLNLPVN